MRHSEPRPAEHRPPPVPRRAGPTVAALALEASAALEDVRAATGLRRVLLVDEEAFVLSVMRPSLERNGYEVDTALDGDVALGLLREARYAALVVGTAFAPGGRGLCEAVARAFGDAAPLMLAIEDDSGRAWTHPAGGVERVERPVSLRWIVARLNAHVGAYERR